MKHACLNKSTDEQFYFLLFMLHVILKCTDNTVVTGYKRFTSERAEKYRHQKVETFMYLYYGISPLNEVHD
jgi:hypothetical protein